MQTARAAPHPTASLMESEEIHVPSVISRRWQKCRIYSEKSWALSVVWGGMRNKSTATQLVESPLLEVLGTQLAMLISLQLTLLGAAGAMLNVNFSVFTVLPNYRYFWMYKEVHSERNFIVFRWNYLSSWYSKDGKSCAGANANCFVSPSTLLYFVVTSHPNPALCSIPHTEAQKQGSVKGSPAGHHMGTPGLAQGVQLETINIRRSILHGRFSKSSSEGCWSLTYREVKLKSNVLPDVQLYHWQLSR